jgi:hypothetical protein
MHNKNHGRSNPKNMGYFINLPKLPKVNTHPMCENSPNLVTLPSTNKRRNFPIHRERKKNIHPDGDVTLPA